MHIDNSTNIVNPYIGDIPYYPGDLTYWGWGRTGWICPKCGRVNSPDTYSCPCSEPGRTTTTTGTTPYWESLPKTYSSNLEDYLDEFNKQSERNLTEEEKKEFWRKFYC